MPLIFKKCKLYNVIRLTWTIYFSDIRNNRLTWLSGEMLEGVTSNLMRM